MRASRSCTRCPSPTRRGDPWAGRCVLHGSADRSPTWLARWIAERPPGEAGDLRSVRTREGEVWELREHRKLCIQRLEWFVWAHSQGPCGVLQEEAGRGQAAAESTSERRRHRRGAGVAPRQQQRRGAAPAAARSWGVCRRRRRQPRRRWRRLGRRRPAAVATAARVGLPVAASTARAASRASPAGRA